METYVKIDGLGEHRHFLPVEVVINHKKDLIRIYNAIVEALKEYPDFDGIEFFAAFDTGIRVDLHHKKYHGYIYAGQPVIKYDFSNSEEVINQAVKIWQNSENPEYLKNYLDFQQFLDWGDKYGFD